MTAATRKLGFVRKVGSSFVALAGLGLFLAWLGGAFGARIDPGEVSADRPSAAGRELVLVKRNPVEETIKIGRAHV